MWGMHAALSIILEVGPQIIESHILALTGALLDEFREAEGTNVYSPEALGERSGIFTIVPPDGVDPTAAFEELSCRKLFLSLRGGKLRYSPHFYNSMDEIRTAASMTKEVFKTLAAR
jgi:selenocysteine lyase/cysteine desulfurase